MFAQHPKKIVMSKLTKPTTAHPFELNISEQYNHSIGPKELLKANTNSIVAIVVNICWLIYVKLKRSPSMITIESSPTNRIVFLPNLFEIINVNNVPLTAAIPVPIVPILATNSASSPSCPLEKISFE